MRRATPAPIHAAAALCALLSATPAAAQYSDWEAAEQEIEPREQNTPEGDGAEETLDEASTDEAGAETEDDGEAPTLEEVVGTQEGLPDEGRLGIRIDGAFFFGDFSNTFGSTRAAVVSPIVGVSYLVTNKLRVGAEWGFAAGGHSDFMGPTGGEDADFGFRAGNPYVYAEWLPRLTDLEIGLHGGMGFPAADADTTGEILGLIIALGQRGAWDAWLWVPDQLSLVAGADMTLMPIQQLFLTLEADFALLFPVGTSGEDGADPLLQLAADARYDLNETLGFGLRVQAVFTSDLPRDSLETDNNQFSGMPYARLGFGRSSLLLGFQLNFDAPFSSFDEGVWAARAIFDSSF